MAIPLPYRIGLNDEPIIAYVVDKSSRLNVPLAAHSDLHIAVVIHIGGLSDVDSLRTPSL